jgi:thymidine kinase
MIKILLACCLTVPVIAADFSKGSLTVITGPMYSGKTACLIDCIKAVKRAGKEIYVYSHCLDYRRDHQLSSRACPDENIKAFKTDSSADIMMDYFKGSCRCVAIDEVQFFKPELIRYIRLMLECETTVYVSGLDTNYRGEPFGDTMEQLIRMANTVVKLTATCSVCGKDATMTQRLVNGLPAKTTDALLVVEGSNDTIKYEPRCKECHVIK